MADRMPAAALWLGVAGLVPFIACTLQIVAGWPLEPRMTGPALYALTIFSGAILAFMGGVQWGLAVARPEAGWRAYGISVLPVLAACAGLWIGARMGLLTFAAGFVALLFYDLWTVSRGEAPGWYGRLRIGLTSVVAACLTAAAQLGPF
jgi:hypothetical protein